MQNVKRQEAPAPLITVRPFRDGDEHGFMDFGHYLQTENYKGCGYNPKKVLWLFSQLVMGNPEFYGVIAEASDGAFAGLFVGKLEPYYFSDEKIANDLGFGLLPAYREGAAAVLFEMISGFEEWAKEQGAMETCIATSAGMNGTRLETFLNSLGYETVGYTTKKRIR